MTKSTHLQTGTTHNSSHAATHNFEALTQLLQGGAMPADKQAFHKLLTAVQSELRKSAKPNGGAKLGKVKQGKHVLERLAAQQAKNLKTPGSHADGGGLYLHISPTGAKSWVFRYTRKLGAEKAKAREMGLGAFHTVGLADARDKALQCRKLLADGIDPIEHRKQTQAGQQLQKTQTALAAQKTAMTFDMCAEKYIETHRAGWGNDKHEQQWTNTLAAYASPVIGSKPVGEIDPAAVLEVFTRDKFWETKTETAQRVRQRIEKVLDWAAVQKYRSGDNPARWGGCMEHLLVEPSSVKVVSQMPSLPNARLPEFMAELRQQKGMGAKALEFQILTTVRPGEAYGAMWAEIDLEEKVWTIPAERMKGVKGKRKEHRVPLSGAAIELLRQVEKEKVGGVVFPMGGKDKVMSDMTLGKVIKTMNAKRQAAGQAKWVDPKVDGRDVVPHGFRSTFSTYIANETEFSKDLREACLAHIVEGKTAGAYQRGDLFDKRRELLTHWQVYCEGKLT